MRRFTAIFASAFLLQIGAHADPPPKNVVVLANAADLESIALARHYLRSRNLPETSLVTLPLRAEEEIPWSAFIHELRNPLLKELLARGLVEGEPVAEPDAEGRTHLRLRSKHFDHLVLCKGVPLKIAHDETRFNLREKSLPLPPNMRVNCASVDSELTLLTRTETPLAGFVPNPRYNRPPPADETSADTLMTARLDGPTYADARRLVDHAQEAERTGLLGRAYIDIGGPHKLGDDWLRATADIARNIAFDVETEDSPALFKEGDRFDSPALYFGWYSGTPSGILANPRFRFPPGAVAVHIHSFSAHTLRSADAGWTGPLVARGATVTVGNVYEPYLELTHNPAILLDGLTRGLCAGEAAARAIPSLSWQCIFVGDPLYRPFAHDLDRQLADLEKHPDSSQAYAVLRLSRILDARGDTAGADSLIATALRKIPVLPLARGKLDRDLAKGRRAEFRAEALADLPEDPGLVLSTAEALVRAGLSEEALKLLGRQQALGVRFDPRAADLALRLGRPELAARLRPRAP